jgi:hypothetical protein
MILYVNGDSHTAGAEAVNSHAFAEDDGRYNYLGRLPHPENLAVSWGQVLANALKMGFKCDAESGASNTRIIRTTRNWLARNPQSLSEILLVIQWSTWERQEWLIDGEYFQVNASGVDIVPESHQLAYKKFIADIDYFQVKQAAHQEVWNFHNELAQMGVRHIFFNADMAFNDVEPELDWGNCYVNPYDKNMTYSGWLKNNGHSTVAPDSYHFGQTAHAAWAGFMLQYIVANKFI